ncbi:MAG: hypothetical protein GY903_13250 [Fuerstiella sp.]|nr:hypothetical protein [Fuerstiella sp.]MCP4855451.1 hypothetical protein [Fuerstiella sp.]
MLDNGQTDIEALENLFPPASGVAFSDARSNVLASGQSVLQSEDGVIYEVAPDGSRKEVKKIDPPVNVVSGQRIKLL